MPAAAHKYARPLQGAPEKPPAISVRYFHASSTPIDDPLAPLPPPPSHAPTTSDTPLHPFSPFDNAALDSAWNNLRVNILRYKDEKRRAERQITSQRSETPTLNLPVLFPANDTRRRRSDDVRRSSTESPLKFGTSEGSQKTLAQRSRNGSESGEGKKDTCKREDGEEAHETLNVRESMEHDVAHPGLARKPFARAPARLSPSSSREGLNSVSESIRDAKRHHSVGSPEQALVEPSAKLPVGSLRLYEVSMPGLDLRPIYWNSVHDVSAVVRGTWFYKSSMLPVEPEVANLLEKGYLELKPWTETWNDELNSAVEVGAAGEARIAYQLWPDEAWKKPGSRPNTAGTSTLPMEDDNPDFLRKSLVHSSCDFIDEVMAGTDIDNKAAAPSMQDMGSRRNLYLRSSIIYANEREAFLLRPNLQPSSYYGRRPLANYIRKGYSIGICVVRGFDQAQWNSIYHPKGKSKATETSPIIPNVPGDPFNNASVPWSPNTSPPGSPGITDLVLVIHGIGQKLSERVESFHFTHAINTFRRQVHVELSDTNMKGNLRGGAGGIMVLPVNWRSTLSFDEGGYNDTTNPAAENHFTLKDITPESLPSVRNIISDVMLDIPYYLSHHQPKMISAVIREANRIHRLWCENNPGFEKEGRTHLIAHSLGSVMIFDILSRQPTIPDDPRSLSSSEDEDPQHFHFDTKNLYICGSPAGFFLLLKRAGLLPRRGREKPTSGGDDSAPGIAGDQGTYGCLAVDNIYNIVNPYDPVANLLNAAVDSSYAASLKPAVLPSATTSWFGRLFKTESTRPQVKRPGPIQRLPSNVELETHNFTREEIAEKRAYLLNDNGQIDYFLRYGGGPLEIQYLTMLGAHSSYWYSKDFARFITVETGREPGREGTLPAMRAAKKKTFAS